MQLLRQLIEQLESLQKGRDIDVQLERLSAYGLRNLVNFDKYTALFIAESLASDAKQNSHPKASFLSMASQTMRGYLDKDPKQFRAYFLALFAEKEYTQVLDRIPKVDKSLLADRTSSQFPPDRSSGRPLRSSAIICDFCGIPDHTLFRCFRRMSNQRAGSGRFSPYSRAPRGHAGLPCITFACLC